MSRYSRQHVADNPPDNNRQATPQRRQQPQRQTQTQTQIQPTPQHTREHLHLQRRYRSTSFKLREVLGGTPRQLVFARSEQLANQRMGQGHRTLAHKVSQSCECRERKRATEQRDVLGDSFALQFDDHSICVGESVCCVWQTFISSVAEISSCGSTSSAAPSGSNWETDFTPSWTVGAAVVLSGLLRSVDLWRLRVPRRPQADRRVTSMRTQTRITSLSRTRSTSWLSVGDAVVPSLWSRVSRRIKEDGENGLARRWRFFPFGSAAAATSSDGQAATKDSTGQKKNRE